MGDAQDPHTNMFQVAFVSHLVSIDVVVPVGFPGSLGLSIYVPLNLPFLRSERSTSDAATPRARSTGALTPTVTPGKAHTLPTRTASRPARATGQADVVRCSSRCVLAEEVFP